MESVKLETVSVEKSKMSLAAKKAWDTIRAKKLSSSQAEVKTGVETGLEIKQETVKAVKVKAVKTEKEIVEKATVWDRKELAELNGDEMRKLARDNGKRAEKNIKKQKMGSEARAIEIGGIIKQVMQNGYSGFKAETKV